MNHLISVIIPVYNTETYLQKCVASVIQQTYRNLEVILVDDGSKKPAHDLCDELAKTDNRIKVIHKKNGGLSSSRNVGIDVSTGDYVSFLDSDDYLAEDFYESLIKSSPSKNTIACSHIVRVDEYGMLTHRNDPHIGGGQISMKEYVRELLLHIGDVSTCSKLFSKSLIGNTRFDEGILNEDLLFMIEMATKAVTLSFTGKIGYYYLVRSGSISTKYGKAIEDMATNSIKVRNIAYQSYPELKEEADRFALFQNMAYLLLVPKSLRVKSNTKYKNAVSYVRKYFFFSGMLNKYLSIRDKCIIAVQCVFPSWIASYYQRKH